LKLLSTISSLWNYLPVVVRAVATGLVVTSLATLPWALLVGLNLKYGKEWPWAAAITALYIWFYWKFVRGIGWPRLKAAERNKNCRAHDLPGDVWAGAIGAGMLGLVWLLVFQSVYSRMVHLPTQSGEDLSGVPTLTLLASLVMSAIVAGTSEEAGFRGYMQGPIEERHGPVIALLVTGAVFGFLHFTHKEVTMALMPWYMGVALVYGALAYITKSIMPGVVLHAGGNMFGALQLIAGDRNEWQTSTTPQPLIWETGPDASFWLALMGLVVLTAAAVWAYAALAGSVRKSFEVSEG
jgi:membrane protease YdiL (CAAX protease family)